ncbi:MAG: hypothetical protein AAF211_14515, partial [Myxococcota bacterium]
IVPLYVFYVVHRLVVTDRSGGTHAFVAALPVSAPLRYLGQLALAATAVALLVAIALGLTAALAVTREGLPPGWLGQLLWQFELYALAWLALDFGVAHLGRFRVLAWVLVLSLALVVDGPDVDMFGDVLWHSVLQDPIDQTRSHPPIADIPIAASWIGAGALLGLGLVTYRGGVVTERLFERGTDRGYGVQILLGLMIPSVLEVVLDIGIDPRRDAWSDLARKPVAEVDLRVAGPRGGPLWAVGRDAATDLATLAARTGLGPFPTVVLVNGPAVDFEEVRRTPDRNVVLVVDVDHDHADLVRRIVYRTLLEHSAWLTAWNSKTDWLLRGTPGWLRPDPVLEARAAAGRAALPHLPNWLRMELEVGEDVSEGVAWAAVEALPDDAVVALLRHVLSRPVPRATLLEARRLDQHLGEDWVGTVTGIDLVPHWRDAVLRWTADVPPAHDGFGLAIEAREQTLYATWTSPPPPGAQLRWRRLDPMALHPGPGDDEGIVELTPDGSMEVVLPLDATVRAVAEFAWYDPELAGIRTTGWGARW